MDVLQVQPLKSPAARTSITSNYAPLDFIEVLIDISYDRIDYGK